MDTYILSECDVDELIEEILHALLKDGELHFPMKIFQERRGHLYNTPI
jgi:hypothetical protein